MIRHAWFLGALGAFGLIGLHCSTSPTPSAAIPSLPPPQTDTSSVCVTLGPAGGTITHAAGAQLVVPAGALDSSTSLCLVGVAAPAADALGASALAQGFDARPAGQTFHRPIEIVVPFDPTRVTGGASLDAVQLRMAPQNTNDFVWLSSTVDLPTRTVRAKTVHFTQFVPAQNPNPLFITTPPTLPSGVVGVSYTVPLTATGGAPSYAWEISPSSVTPAGLALNATGSLDGTPSVPDNYAFFLTVSDSASPMHHVQAAFSLTVTASTNAVPSVAQVSPSSAPQGSPETTIDITGTGFSPSAQALWDGTPIPTTFVTDTHLAAAIPAADMVDAGVHQLVVSNPAPGGGTSLPLTFTVSAAAQNPVPTLASVTPTTLPLSNVDTQLVVTGTGFIAGSSVAIGAQGISTHYVSATQLLGSIPASYLAASGTLQIDVFNPAPGGGFSESLPIVVGTLNPMPVVTTLAPSSVIAGSGAFALTVTGSGFVTGGQIFFGSTQLVTTVSSATSASATVSAALVSQSGSANVTFVNPAPGGGSSTPATFVITPVPNDAGANDGGIGDAGAPDAASSDTGADAVTGGPLLATCSRRFGNAKPESAYPNYPKVPKNVAIDASGNILLMAQSVYFSDFGAGTFQCSANPCWVIAKLDASCNTLWAQELLGTDPTMYTDDQGNVYTTASGKVSRLDSAGNVLWTFDVDGTFGLKNRWLLPPAASPDGTATFITTTTGGGYRIFKLSATGRPLWHRDFGIAPGANYGGDFYAIASDSTGAIVVSGQTLSVNRFDLGLGGVLVAPDGGVTYGTFIAKFDSVTGTTLWSNGFPGDGIGETLAFAANDDIMLGGPVSNFIDFRGGNVVYGSSNFMGRIGGQTGSVVWANALPGIPRFDTTGNAVYVTPGAMTTLDGSGNPLSVVSLSFPTKSFGYGFGYGAFVSFRPGKMVWTGAFVGTIDFGQGPLTTQGPATEIFVASFPH